MKKIYRNILLIIFGIILILFLGITIYLSVAAKQIKGMLEDEFSYQLELNCEIRGDIKVRIIPGIKLKLYDVYFDNGKEEILSGEQVNVTIPFSILFDDKVVVNELELVRPKFNVWYDESGASSWSLIGMDVPMDPSDTVEFEYNIDLRKIRVKNGYALFTDKTYGDTITLDNVNISSDSMKFTGSNLGIDWENSFFTGSLKASHFRLNSFTFRDIDFDVSGRNRIVEISYASEKMFEGADVGNLTVNHQNTPARAIIKHRLTGFRIEELLGNLDMDSTFFGYMDFESKLEFNLDENAFESMTGEIILEGYDLVLYGYDVDDFLAKFEKSQRFTLIDVSALFVAGPLGPVVTKGYDFARLMVPSRHDTSFLTGFKSHWTITNGVAEATDVALATNNHRLAAKGEIDFAHSEFNDFSIAVLNEYGCATVQQTINGSFADPQSKGVSKVGALLGPVKNFFKGIFKKKKNCPRFYEGKIQHPALD